MTKGNTDNLRKLSTEEAREIGAKGGKASVESRRNKKYLQEALQKALKGKYEIEGKDKQLGGYDALAISMVEAAIAGSVKAFVAIRDTIGEKPTDTVEFENEDLQGIKVTFVNKSNPKTIPESDPKIVGDYTPPTNIEE